LRFQPHIMRDLRFLPHQQPVIPAQALSLAQIALPGMVEAKEAMDLLHPQQRQERIATEAPIRQG